MKKFIKITAFAFLAVTIIGFITILLLFSTAGNVKLDKNKLTSSSQTIEVYSFNGNLVDKRTNGASGEFVSISNLKEHTKNAFIAIEDKRFYSHNGVDAVRILGATLKNIKSLSLKEGGSTITQQLIKNTHLSSEKTFKRKIQEIKLALELENNYSKDEILELYLNTIYFGKGAYGIESASKTYFNKSASELTLNESATLSAIIKAPSLYSPIDNYKLNQQRKDLILSLMKKYGYVTDKEFNENYNKDVEIIYDKNDNFLKDYLNAVYLEFEQGDNFIPYGNQTVKIYTYLNEELQRDISTLNYTDYDDSKIVINSKISGVIAYNGKYSNMKRCPASCVKPWLVYAPMIDSGYVKESSVILDQKENFNGYTPNNFNDKFYGKVTIKQAIEKSLNVPAVKLLNGFGIDKANNYANLMNVDIKNEGLSCALGSISGGLTLKELCDKYSVFNDGGNYTESSFIDKIYYGDIKVYERKVQKTKVFKEETAYIISDALKSAVENGTSKKLRSLNYCVYAKTGTNGGKNGNLDALSVSYTNDVIVGVWIGNYDNTTIPNTISGGTTPTEISRRIYEKYYKNETPTKISKPINVEERKIDIDNLLNNEVELISKDGETFYYIKGSEPTAYLEDLSPDLINSKILLNNGNVKLLFNCLNTDKIIIKRKNGDKTIQIYDGKVITEMTDTLKSFGNYVYEITLINDNKTIIFEFEPIYFSKNSLNITNNDKWLYE